MKANPADASIPDLCRLLVSKDSIQEIDRRLAARNPVRLSMLVSLQTPCRRTHQLPLYTVNGPLTGTGYILSVPELMEILKFVHDYRVRCQDKDGQK